jgi:cytochrome P450
MEMRMSEASALPFEGEAGRQRCPITFSDPETRKCPFPAYQRLRDEEPVYQDPVTGNYILTRYRDVRRAVLNTKTLSNKTGVALTRESTVSDQVDAIYAEGGWVWVDTLVTNDPPQHRLFRGLVDKVFTSAKVASLEPVIEAAVDTLLDRLEDRPEADFFAEFAMRLPIMVFSGILGVNKSGAIFEDEIRLYKQWSDVALESSSPVLAPERELEIARIQVQFQQFLAGHIERVRKAPDDSLLSTLVHAKMGDREMDMQELVSVLQQLFVAGAETTANAIAGGVKLLADRPDLASLIRKDPAKLDAFVEETLRIMAPATTMFRRATEDIVIGDVSIPKGSIIETRFGAANLDPEVYPNPEVVDLERPNGQSHLTFGAGIHMCIGNQLARGELRIALKGIADRLDHLKPSRGQESYQYTSTYVAYGLTMLWLSFSKRSR